MWLRHVAPLLHFGQKTLPLLRLREGPETRPGNVPSSIPTRGRVGTFLVDQIRSLAKDDEVIAELVTRSRNAVDTEIDNLRAERKGLAKLARQLTGKIKKALTESPSELADLGEKLGDAERRVTEIDDGIERAKRHRLDQDELMGAVEAFDPVWERLNPSEQAELVRLVVRQVEYDAETETATVTFHANGIQSLANEQLVA